MQPETREILRCVYAPRSPTPEEIERQQEPASRPVEASGQALAKQSILGAGFPDAVSVQSLLKSIRIADFAHGKQIAQAAVAIHASSPGSAGPLLADVPVGEVASFAREAVFGRGALLARQVKSLAGSGQGKGKAAPAATSTSKTASAALGSATVFNPTLFWMQTEAQVSVDAVLNADQRARLSLIDELERSARVDPVGFLHLERLHFTPVAYRRGDLMHALTLTPGEVVRVTTREWSRTEREFTSLVSESIEREQEDALTEKTELTESAASQDAHSMAFSASLTASGNYGLFSFAANAGIQLSQQTSTTRESSKKSARELTRRAASRTKQEHKVTFRVFSAREYEETNYRELSNQSAEPVRWDFHRLMREWEVKLYRYGVRLTYDLTIPEPGSYLLRLYSEVQDLETRIAQPLALPSQSEVTVAGFAQLQSRYGLVLEPPPTSRAIDASATSVFTTNDSGVAGSIEIPIPDGYELGPRSVTAQPPIEATKGPVESPEQTSRTNMMAAANLRRLETGPITGVFSWHFTVNWWRFPQDGSRAVASVQAIANPSAATIAGWRGRVYGALVEALRARHDERVAQLAQRRDAVLQQLEAQDTLDLRRIEREEVVKGVLRWVLGPGFRFYPSDLPTYGGSSSGSGDLDDPGIDEAARGLYDAYTGAVVDEETWRAGLRHGQLINFLHQAIEWENVNFVLYPYFWAEHGRWDFKQRLRHSDDTHWQFLRAGAARVVLTIRPGYEAAWLRFADSGELGLGRAAAAGPYRTIGEELKAAAETYTAHTEGVQPLDEPGLEIASWREWTPTGALDISRGETLTVAD